MDTTFALILIVAVAAVISVGAAFFIRKRRGSHKKTTNLVHHFIEVKARSRAKTTVELERLEKAYEAGEIDEETYERLKSVLVDVKGKKDEEIDVFKYVLKKSKKQA